VRQKLTAITAEIDNGTFTQEDKTTVEQWLNIWLNEYMGDKKYGTIRNYKNACRYHIIPYIGQCRLSDLKPHMIQTLYNRLQRGEDDKPPLSSKTIRNVHGVLSKVLNQAVWNEMIRLNPAQLTTLPRKVQKDIQTCFRRSREGQLPQHPEVYPVQRRQRIRSHWSDMGLYRL